MAGDTSAQWSDTMVYGAPNEEAFPRPLTFPYLIVLQGPDAGQRFKLTSGRVTVGRSDKVDVKVNDPKMSGVHFAIYVGSPEITIEDLKSRNGTYIDGERIDKKRISSQAHLRAGLTLMRLVYRSDAEMELEAALIQSERMAAVGTLAAGIAHQFNNINAAVLGFADLALRQEHLDAQVRKWLEIIRKSAERSASLTNSLLVFCGKRPPKAKTRRLDQIVMETIDLVRAEYESEGVCWELNLPKVPIVSVDGSQIAQVVLQLLINARHALLGQSEKKISVETGANEHEIWLRVKDTGCGIPEEDLSQIFTPFFSTKGEHARGPSPLSQVRGPGLGLSVSHTVVTNHGGKLTVQSKVGRGSVFTMMLPRDLVSEAASQSTANGRVKVQAGGRKILILDDEKDIRALLTSVLHELGFKVFSFGHGAAALSWLTENEVDGVLVDLQMPSTSGLEFLKALRGTEKGAALLAVVVTGKTHDLDLKELEALGVTRIIQKPFTFEGLQDDLGEALKE